MVVFLVGEQLSSSASEIKEAKFSIVYKDGVAPDDFYSTTNLPTYVCVNGKMILPKDSRMDSVIVKDSLDNLVVRGISSLRQGEQVLLGQEEDGSHGILVKISKSHEIIDEKFSFMNSDVTREKQTKYSDILNLLIENKKDGYIIWVLGPAVVHSRAGKEMEWLINKGYVDVLFGGNAVAVHDIEYALYGTTLGLDDKGKSVHNGHRKHMDAINTVRKYNSIEEAVKQNVIKQGIMYSCIKRKIPFVLAGSIRDDGPLTDTITDTIRSQELMREHTKKATCVIMLASALHSIATGNMLPCYREVDGQIKDIDVVCVDQDEFVVKKLMDRGTHQAYGVVANAQDFLYRVVNGLKK